MLSIILPHIEEIDNFFLMKDEYDIMKLVILLSLDGRFLQRLASELHNVLQEGRIQKIHQLAKADFLWMIRTPGKNHQLILSTSSGFGRIHLTSYDYDKPFLPSGFCMFLRKYFEGGLIQGIRSVSGDRIIEIKIQNTSEIGETSLYYAYLELMGKYTNFIITDDSNIIIESYLHISILEGKDRAFMKGLKYELPQDSKIDPNDEEAVFETLASFSELSSKQLIEHIKGTSPLFADYFVSTFPTQTLPMNEYFRYLQTIDNHPTMSVGKKTKFYYFDVFDEGIKTYYESLSAMLDVFYFERSRNERMKQIGKNIVSFVKRELDKNVYKLEKLENELIQAKNNESLRMDADLIKSNQHLIQKGMRKLVSFHYETNQERSVSLDPLLSPVENLQQAYKRYKKQKSAVGHIEHQIELTKQEIEYFDQLTAQIDIADASDILEIADELSFQNYLKAKPSNKKKSSKINADIFEDHTQTIYTVGKNNLQNEVITHKLGKPNDWWFHVQGMPGSHVLVQSTSVLSEPIIRYAAQLASLYSKARLSSSVPVDYTQIKFIKKIPGKKGYFVSYSNQKTIYIDPDPSMIASLKKKK
jgi:predicted ribosome quality control (RQC) complex YloA/Tae2 family protein